MAKYIDADLLRKEIEKRLKNVRDYMNGVGMKYKGPKYYKAQGKESAYDALLSIIASFQQEQRETDGDDGKFVKILVRKEFAEQIQRLGDEIQAGQSSFVKAMNRQEQPEIDLEKEIDNEWKKCNPIDEGMGVESAYIYIEAFDIIAHHFFELGQKDAANKYDEIEYNRQRAEEENK